ncbi:MAG: glutaminyl-peptide cyclotransferase [Glaciecola sp.]|jgi:glutaminyl-peptide cyclotransferase
MQSFPLSCNGPQALPMRLAPIYNLSLVLCIALGSTACSHSKGPDQGPQEENPKVQTVQAVAPVYDGARAWKDMQHIVGMGPRPAGSATLEQLRFFLDAELRKVNLEPVWETFENVVPITADTPAGKLTFTNLYADLISDLDPEAPLVMVASHMDTKFLKDFVGANDAGSSTAAVLELARAITASTQRSVSYRFIFFDGEEAVRPFWQDPDNTYGSRHHAHEFSKKAGFQKLKAVVLLDLVGDKDLRLSPDLNSTPWLRKLFDKAIIKGGYGKHLGARSQRLSDDHLPFRALSIPVLDLIDFEYGPDNRYWHSSDDTMDKCSEESLTAIGKMTLLGLKALSQRLVP